MNRRTTGFILVALIGIGLIGYGLYTGDQGTRSLGVLENVNQSAFNQNPDVDIIEYDYLDPWMQDKFRKALQSNSTVSISRDPGFKSSSAIHYRNRYYGVLINEGDAGLTTMTFSIAGGIGLILTSFGGWYFSSKSRNHV